MSAIESSSGEQKPSYLSKRVMINGQFVTLYSLNGQTWLSSPEDIPEMMARLDNSRVTLTEPKDKNVKGEGGDKDKGESSASAAKAEKQPPAPVKPPGAQYRMKGPKPRPVLRQGGKVVEGTPVEPISGSSVNIKGAVDTSVPSVKLSPMEKGLRRGKLVAPLAQKRPGKPKIAPPPPSKKASPAVVKGALKSKSEASVAQVQKISKGAKVQAPPVGKVKKVVVSAKPAQPVKAAKAAPVAKSAAKKVAKRLKLVKKPAKQKVVAKKVSAKPVAKRRSR